MQTSKSEFKVNQNYTIEFKLLELSKKEVLAKIVILKDGEVQAETEALPMHKGEIAKVNFNRNIDCSMNFTI